MLARSDKGGSGLGCCAVQPLPANPFGSGAFELKRMFVMASSRRHGVGTALGVAALTYARRQGGSSMFLETGIRQPEAVRVYTRLGFQRIAPFPPYLDDPFALCFQLDLALADHEEGTSARLELVLGDDI